MVYGYPALLAATDLRLQWSIQSPKDDLTYLRDQLLLQSSLSKILEFLHTQENLEILVESDIPVGSGLGSSAAFSIGLASLILPDESSPEGINELAYQFETIQHGKPSGGDNTISCYGGVLWYRKETEQCKLFRSLTPLQDFPKLWLIDSGGPLESTKDMVELVRARRVAHQNTLDLTFREMEKIARAWLEYLLGKEMVDVGELIRDNHQALVTIGVVSAATQELISKIELMGGSAKITGAGGVAAGSGMVMVYHQDTDNLLSWAKENRLSLMPVQLGRGGLEKSERKETTL